MHTAIHFAGNPTGHGSQQVKNGGNGGNLTRTQQHGLGQQIEQHVSNIQGAQPVLPFQRG